jgi:hypothetical protein
MIIIPSKLDSLYERERSKLPLHFLDLVDQLFLKIFATDKYR